jgi:hypothetical protein
MAKALKTYVLAPAFIFPPDGPLRLGAILPNPTRPEDVLNIESVVQTDERSVISTTKIDWQFLYETRKPSGVSPDSQEPSQLFHADELITKYFYPSSEYTDKSMESENVVQYVHQKRFSACLYMVTGVKIACNATVRSFEKDIREAKVQIVDASAAGVPLELGLSAPLSSPAGKKIVSKASEFVFAYSLRKIVYGKRLWNSLLKPYTKGATFSTHADLWNWKEGDEDAAQLELIDVLGLEKKDLDADDWGVSSTSLVDDSTGDKIARIISS